MKKIIVEFDVLSVVQRKPKWEITHIKKTSKAYNRIKSETGKSSILLIIFVARTFRMTSFKNVFPPIVL